MIPYSKLKNTNRKNLKEILPLAKPFTLIIEPTNLCNFKCTQCFQSICDENYFTKNKEHMSMECFDRIINSIKAWDGPKLRVLKLSLYGEPFTNLNFVEMVRIAREANIAERIETTTNASLLNADICAKLVEYGLDYMRVSIYSAIPQKHTSITQSNVSVRQIHDNLKLLQDVKRNYSSALPFISVKMIDTYSSDENNAFTKLYHDVADELYFDKPHNWIPYKGKDFINELYGNNINKAIEDIENSSSSRIACTLPFFTIVVRSNGDVSPCCIDWVGETNIGNVYDESIFEIWNGERLFAFRKMQLENRKFENDSCKNCEFYLNDYYTRDNIDGFPIDKLKPKSVFP